jgi:hypothetical protein
MTTTPPEPGDRRPAGARPRLERAPGERYGTAGSSAPADVAPGSTGRAIAFGGLAALGGALLIVVLGGVLAMTAGLIVAAGLVGWLIGAVVTATAAPASTRARRRAIASGLALASLVLAQLGLWLFARAQGGTLELVDYLVQTRGLLVPIEVAVAAATAWWTTR